MPAMPAPRGGGLVIPGAEKKDLSKRILGGSIGIALLFSFLAVLDQTGALSLPLEWIDWVIFALMIMIGPYGFYVAAKQKRIKQIEERLPEFLRDVAEAGRFGMTLAESIVVASSGRYGTLTPEIKKMAAQIEWGVPANEALRLFSQRVRTPLVQRMTSIIMKASDAGGKVADVLTMVSHDARENIISEKEKSIEMSTYVAVIYIAFGVFLATIIILTASFLPTMEEAGSQLEEQLQGVEEQASFGGMGQLDVSIIPEISMIFLLASLVHAVGDGIMAGVLQKGSIPIGMRHSFIMIIMTFVVLRVFF